MADQLATPESLASLLQSDLDRSTAELLIEAATAVVQAVTGQRIVRVADDEVTVEVEDAGSYLTLPQRPVVSVASVEIGATAVTDWTLSTARSRLWRADGWRSTLVAYVDEPSTATVVYTHGYLAADQGIQLARSATLSLAAAVYSNPSGASRVQIDDYAAAYEAMATRMEASRFVVGALQRRYGRPIGSVKATAAGAAWR